MSRVLSATLTLDTSQARASYEEMKKFVSSNPLTAPVAAAPQTTRVTFGGQSVTGSTGAPVIPTATPAFTGRTDPATVRTNYQTEINAAAARGDVRGLDLLRTQARSVGIETGLTWRAPGPATTAPSTGATATEKISSFFQESFDAARARGDESSARGIAKQAREFGRPISESLRAPGSATTAPGPLTAGVTGGTDAGYDRRIAAAGRREAEARERAAGAAERRAREVDSVERDVAPSRRGLRGGRADPDWVDAFPKHSGYPRRPGGGGGDDDLMERFERNERRLRRGRPSPGGGGGGDDIADLKRELFDEPRRRLDRLSREVGDYIADDVEAVPVDEGGGRGRGRRGTRRSFSGSLAALRRSTAFGFVAYEALRVGEAFETRAESYRLARGDPFKQISAEQQFQQTVGGVPIVGQLASLAATDMQRLGFFFGGTGQTTTTAVADAQRGLAEVEARSNRMVQSRGDTSAADSLHRQTVAVSSLDSTTQRIASIRGAQLDYFDRIANETFARQEAIKNETNPDKKRQLENDFETYFKDAGRRQTEFDALSGALEARARIDQTTATTNIGLGTSATQFSRQGYYRSAGMASVRQQFTKFIPKYSADGRRIESFGAVDDADQAQALKDAYATQIDETEFNETARLEARKGENAAMRSILARNPLQAQYDRLEAQRRIELIGKRNPKVIAEINTQYDLARQVADQQDSDSDDRISLGLTARRRQVAALRGRKYHTAELEGLVGQIDQGQLGLKDRPEQRRQFLEDSLGELDLFKREYFRNFRGQQVDISNLGAGNARQGESIADVVTAIQKAVSDLQQTIANIGSDN